MRNKQILKKAIEKAVKSGMPDLFKGEGTPFSKYADYDWKCLIDFGYKEIIFSHDFAKSFWGEETKHQLMHPETVYVDWVKDIHACKPAWQYHLQIVVLEKEPLKYLKKFLTQ